MVFKKNLNPPIGENVQLSLTSEVIRAIRLPLTLMVVYIHSFGEPKVVDTMAMNYLHLSLFDVYNLIRVAISQAVAHCAVPVFYIISGYLFYQKLHVWNVEIWSKKMKSRMKTIIVPYFSWNTLMIVYLVAMLVVDCILHDTPWSSIVEWFSANGWWHLYWDCYVWNLDRINVIGLPMPASAPILVPFWFMRDLIIVLAITPCIYWSIKRCKNLLVLLLIGCYVSGVWIPLSTPCIDAVLFFSIGGSIAISNKDLMVLMSKCKIVSFIFSGLLLPFMIFYNGHNTDVGNIIYPFFVLAMCGTMINIVAIAEKKVQLSILKKYSDTTFFVFASHVFLLKYVKSVVHFITDKLSFGILCDIIEYVITPLFTVCFCIIACRLVQRCLPRTALMLGCNLKK